MFNFTTTTLIHSADQFVANPTNTTAGQVSSGQWSNPSHNTFWVNGVNLFRKENVVAIYRNPYVEPLAGRLVVDVAGAYRTAQSAGLTPKNGKYQYRLKFSLRRTGDNNSYYARDEVFSGKDFVYEWIGGNDLTVEAVAKQIKKINRLYGDIYLDVHVGTDADDKVLKDYDTLDGSAFGEHTETSEGSEITEVNKLVFVNDNFGLFTEATLQVWQDGESDCCHYVDGGWIDIDTLCNHNNICVENCSMIEGCDVLTRGIKDSKENLLHVVECVNGNGTYQQILRDLRLPTMENLGYMSLTQQMQEMPVPGNKYVQYTLHYVACRGILGGSAVGEVTHSKTTHVFFVPADCCECGSGLDTQFKQALLDAFGWTPCEEGRLVPAPHDDPTVEPKYMTQLGAAEVNDTRTANDTEPAAAGTEPVNP